MTINEFKQHKTKTENQNLDLGRVEGNYKQKRNWNKLRNNVRPTPTSKANIKMYNRELLLLLLHSKAGGCSLSKI